MKTTVHISIPKSLKEFIEAQAAQEGYATIDAYLLAVIRDTQKRHAKKKELDTKLLEGSRSPKIRMADKLWKQLEKKVKKRSPELDQG